MTLSSSVWTGYSFKEEIPLVFAAQQKNSRAVRSPTADTRSSLLLGLRDVIPTALYKDIGYDDAEEVIVQVQKGAKPLALFLISTDEAFVKRVIENPSSGAIQGGSHVTCRRRCRLVV